jgi:hypothetical protein
MRHSTTPIATSLLVIRKAEQKEVVRLRATKDKHEKRHKQSKEQEKTLQLNAKK